MPYPMAVPSWIQAADPTTHYLRGLQIGSSIAQSIAQSDRAQQSLELARQRAAEQAQRDMEMAEIRRQTVESNTRLREQALADARERAMQELQNNQVRTSIYGQMAQAQQQNRMIEQGLSARRVAAQETQAQASMLRAQKPPTSGRPPQPDIGQRAEWNRLQKQLQEIEGAILGFRAPEDQVSKMPGGGELLNQRQKVTQQIESFKVANPELFKQASAAPTPTTAPTSAKGKQIGRFMVEMMEAPEGATPPGEEGTDEDED